MAEQSTTVDDIVSTIRSLRVAVDALHEIAATDRDCNALRAEGALKGINALLVGDAIGLKSRLPSTRPTAADDAEAGRLLQVAQLDARVAGEQAADRMAQVQPVRAENMGRGGGRGVSARQAGGSMSVADCVECGGNGYVLLGQPGLETYGVEPERETCAACKGTGHFAEIAVEQTKAQAVAQGLEEMVAWLREHPDFPVSWGGAAGPTLTGYDASVEQFVRFGEEMGAVAVRKYGNLRLGREFSGGVTLHIDATPSLFDEPPAPTEPPLPDELQRFASAPSVPDRFTMTTRGPSAIPRESAVSA